MNISEEQVEAALAFIEIKVTGEQVALLGAARRNPTETHYDAAARIIREYVKNLKEAKERANEVALCTQDALNDSKTVTELWKEKIRGVETRLGKVERMSACPDDLNQKELLTQAQILATWVLRREQQLAGDFILEKASHLLKQLNKTLKT